ncbi:unnamed protein product [Heligmosomoides polygyrus]|uniref:G-protein coupled receptors family 1 profile domain-containing protein n=1 Tax=Heligmosomoides polygyrus TaxID=6339 RepID=A0A3P8D2D1_HELPZ|nr:unnamed protein product [Heligmosomoides polygyrus]
MTFYQHFEYYCLVRSYCHETQLYSRCLPVYSETWFGKRENPFSPLFRQVISLCVLIYALAMIILPIVLLTMLNLMLLCALRKRQKNLSMACDLAERRNNESQLQKTEHRVTLTVTFIVTMFTVTNGPSALMHLLRTAYNLKQQDLYDLTMICSTLVICGKASNFILFCLGSRHFRLRLIRLTQRKMNKKIESLSGTLLTSTMSRAIIARRQSCPSKKTSCVAETPKSRNLSTADIYHPLVRDLPPKHPYVHC